MNSRTNLIQKLFSVCFLLLSSSVIADTCPSAMDVKNRNIPENYEWTVNYEMVLSDLLAVTKLSAVIIENSGEFVSCKYESPRIDVRMDGITKPEKCLITVESGDWFTLDNGRTICQEEEAGNCQYKHEC